MFPRLALVVVLIFAACATLDAADRWRPAGVVQDFGGIAIPAVPLAGGFALRVPGVGACEMFVPLMDRWVPVAALRTPREPGSFSLTRLADGRVLVAGGTVPGSSLDAVRTCEVYNPVTMRWSSTGSMRWGRRYHIAERLANGRVLVAGGISQQVAEDDPATPWLDDEYAFGRFFLGRMQTAETYDPATGRWYAAADMRIAHSGAASAALDDGRVLVYGGYTDGPRTSHWAVSETYDPATNAWRMGANPAFAEEFASTEPLTKLADGRVVTLNGVFSWVSTRPEYWQGPSVFDPRTNAWRPFRAPARARLEARATLLGDGRLLVAGGLVPDGSGGLVPTRAAEFWSPSSHAWTPAPALIRSRAVHRQLRLSDGRVLAIAGLETAGASEVFGAASLPITLSPRMPIAIN